MPVGSVLMSTEMCTKNTHRGMEVERWREMERDGETEAQTDRQTHTHTDTLMHVWLCFVSVFFLSLFPFESGVESFCFVCV